jgi:hypothetical protein
MVSANRKDLPFVQNPTASSSSVTWSIDVTNTDNRVGACGTQCIGSSLEQFHTRVDVPDDPQVPYIVSYSNWV